jgi:hypothetical protein
MRTHAVRLLAIPGYRRFDRTPSDTRPSRIDETSGAWMTETATVVACKRHTLIGSRLPKASPRGAISRLKDNSPEGSDVSRISTIALQDAPLVAHLLCRDQISFLERMESIWTSVFSFFAWA